jgi:hypothetical protein
MQQQQLPLRQQQQQQQRSSGLAFTPMPPAQRQAQQQLLPPSSGGLPQRESSLDRVTAALQHALSVAAGLPGTGSRSNAQSAAGGMGASRRVTNGSSYAQPVAKRSVSRALGMDLLGSSQLGSTAGPGAGVALAGSSSDLEQDSLTPSQVRWLWCAVHEADSMCVGS